MAKTCDNKSVGILVWRDGALLLIERKKYNLGFALPAGHQDGDDPEKAARKELEEEMGLYAETLEKKLTLMLPNPCRREGGTHHEWAVFEAAHWNGEVKPSPNETKNHLWADKEKIAWLAATLENFAQQRDIPLTIEALHELVRASNEDGAWQENPGLEPPMYFIFKELRIL